MAPAVKILGKIGLGRVLPVIVTVLFTFAMLAGLAALIASQFRDLSTDLPQLRRRRWSGRSRPSKA